MSNNQKAHSDTLIKNRLVKVNPYIVFAILLIASAVINIVQCISYHSLKTSSSEGVVSGQASQDDISNSLLQDTIVPTYLSGTSALDWISIEVLDTEFGWKPKSVTHTPQNGYEFVKIDIALRNNNPLKGIEGLVMTRSFSVCEDYEVLRYDIYKTNVYYYDEVVTSLVGNTLLSSGENFLKLPPNGGEITGSLVFQVPVNHKGDLYLAYQSWHDENEIVKIILK